MNFESVLQNFLRASVGETAIIWAIAAVGLNMHFGYTGLLNFGHIAFLAVGAYGLAITVTFLEMSLWVGLGVGVLFGIVLALLLGAPTLRLRADYLAIVTIVAGEILRFLFRSVWARDIFGGSNGLSGFAREFYAVNPLPPGVYGFGWLAFNERAAWRLLVGWTVVLLVVLLSFMLMRSPWGRVLRSIREDEDAARSLGKNVFAYKMQSLVLGGVFGAIAGMFWAISTQAVQPDNFSPPNTFFIFTALILGGAAATWGPVIGSMMFWGLLSATENLLVQAVRAGYIPSGLMDGVQVGIVRFMLVGLGLMLLMIFRPQGVFGNKRELALDA